jgi:FAD dependent oxidoreductase TIGR03364
MVNRPKVAIVGGGIVGLAHAWSAAERGYDVTLFDRSERAEGASIRNFGMIWPIGQPHGELYEIAIASRNRWIRLADESKLWLAQCGSIHLAHRTDEWAVLEEFKLQADALGIPCELLSASQVQQRTPAANPNGLIGGLFSPTECCVNPKRAIPVIAAWLLERYAVRVRMATQIISIDAECSVSESTRRVQLRTSGGDEYQFDRVVVCSGADFHSLFPEVFATSGLKRCKLQMLSVQSPGAGFAIGTHLASGLTLRHYRNFEQCPSMVQLRARIAEETPELDRYGIHVMASQNELGQIILGDSHEYDEDIEPFDKSLIDELILRELRKILHLPNWTIAERWHGIYAKHPSNAVFEAEPMPCVHICTGTGGSGMTMSFGLAEKMWERWTNS